MPDLAGHSYPGKACCTTEAMAVQAWAEDDRFRESIRRQLDRGHASTIAEVGATEVEMIATWTVRADYRRHADLGVLLWALLRDGRPGVERAAVELVRRIQRDALRSLVSGAARPAG